MAALVSSDIPPAPPGYVAPKPKLLSPKLAEHVQSLGAPMAAIPAFVPLPPSAFSITNITVVNGQVSLAWQKGTNTGSFQVEGASGLTGAWSDQGAPTTGSSITIPVGVYHYWRLKAIAGAPQSPGSAVWGQAVGGTLYDIGKVIAVALNGDFFLAGLFQGTVDFTFDHTGGSGVLTSTGGTAIEPFVAKYNSSKILQWVKRVGSSGNTVSAMALDSVGDAYIGGSFAAGGMIKLSPAGSTVWTQAVGVGVSSIVVDSSDKVIFTGSYNGTVPWISPFPSRGIDSYLAKYDSNPGGSLIWVHTFDSTGGSDSGVGVVSDSGDNLFILGRFQGALNFGNGTSNLISGSSASGYLAKFSPGGLCLWSRNSGIVRGSAGVTPFGITMVENNPAVCGTFLIEVDLGNGYQFGTSSVSDGFMVQYLGSDGAWQWQNFILGNGATAIGTTSIASDSSSVLLAGYFAGNAHFGSKSVSSLNTSDYDGFVCKYPTTGGGGTPTWLKALSGSGTDQFLSTAIGPTGNPFVTGGFTSPTAVYDGATLTRIGSTDMAIFQLNP